MKLLINYSDNLYKKSQKLNSIMGKTVGLFDEVICYSSKDIDKNFYKKNKKIYEMKLFFIYLFRIENHNLIRLCRFYYNSILYFIHII